MILDTLNNSTTYENLHPRFKKAFDFLKKTDFSNIKPGKIELDGDNLFATIALTKGIEPNESKVEAHKKYIDIQMPINTTEKMGWISNNDLKTVATEYSNEKDIVFFEEKATSFITVKPMNFVVFFPQDGHQPCIGEGDIKKVIVKVLI